MHSQQRLRRNTALQQQQTCPTQPYGSIAAACIYYESLDNGGGKNSAIPDATHSVSRPAYKCRARRSVAGVCQ